MTAQPLAVALCCRAEADADRAAVTDGATTLTRAEVDRLSDLVATRLLALGATPGCIVAMTGPNTAQLLVLIFAVWKIGATPLPLHARKGTDELTLLLQRAHPVVAVGFDLEVNLRLDPATATTTLEALCQPGHPGRIPPLDAPGHLRVGSSGGSTGTSKLILVDSPAVVNPGRPWHYGMRPDETHVVSLDIVDGSGFFASTTALALGCHLVLMPAFRAEQLLNLTATYRADWLALSSPQMVAVAKLPEQVRASYDLSSVHHVTQYSGAVAPWVKHRWIDWLGPERIAESYGATDGRGSTWIDGATWLERPGSVGQAQRGCEIMIFDDAGTALPYGQLGNVYLRDLTGRRTYRYLGAELTATLPGGWETVGDVGWMDSDRYLYVVDRAKDMIHTDTGLLAPSPIEGALEYHDAVRSAVVIGLPRPGRTERVHAVLDVPSGSLSLPELVAMMADRFPEVRCPESWEICTRPLRDNAGKARRSALRAERIARKV